MKIFLTIYVLAIVCVVSIFGFRGSTSKKEPLEVFPDMDRQARYKPQAENSFFADGRNDRPVPANTVARGNYLNYDEVFSADFEDTVLGNSAYLYGKNPDGSFYQGFPVEPTNELMLKGQQKFNIFCAACHGEAGDGNGVTKPYGVLAANYHDDRLRGVEDGYLYDVISNGKGLMFGLKDRLTPEERWAIVLYVRALQRSQNAEAAELSETKRTELGI
ncbi:c-type cytochrome [Coraliomargarita parva]|uniref:c-type cytochrome n=1 Tax=Coraliomargarita parva TaxID=3014050 RepID=UPI0022B596EB|nr:cytochrome c [Coraliomargarita parva]